MGKVKKIKVTTSRGDQIKQSSLKTSIDSKLKNVKTNSLTKSKSKVTFKSSKLHKPVNKTIRKRDKLNIKRKLLLKKIDVINEMKKERKIREKRKHISIIGDTNSLHDALPSLDALIKSKPRNLSKEPKKNKAIEKAGQRKKKLINDLAIFKQTLKNKTFLNNPFDVISSHVQAVVQKEQSKLNTAKK